LEQNKRPRQGMQTEELWGADVDLPVAVGPFQMLGQMAGQGKLLANLAEADSQGLVPQVCGAYAPMSDLFEPYPTFTPAVNQVNEQPVEIQNLV
jgi:hypothetical protein